MHDVLFQKQAEWASMDVPTFEKWLIDQAGELGLDKDQFKEDLNSEKIVNKVQDAYEHASSVGLPGTPFLLFNGYPYQSSMAYADLANVIEFFKLEDEQYTSCPPQIIDPNKKYQATISTEKGDIVLELYPDIAPLAVNNFVYLAQEGWYDNITFHRVIPDFMAQAGDPSGTGLGGPGYEFANETDPNITFDSAGIIAMANHGADTNGSQFFITYAEAPELNGNYTIFGHVISGMDVLENLTPRDPSQSGGLPPGDLIISITIEEK